MYKVVIGLFSLVMIGALALQFTWFFVADPLQYKQDDTLQAKYDYLLNNEFNYGYASRDTALPAMAVYGTKTGGSLLPLLCDDGLLYRADESPVERSDVKVPVILDNESIGRGSDLCSVQEITRQLGEPLALERFEGATVLTYNSSTLLDVAVR